MNPPLVIKHGNGQFPIHGGLIGGIPWYTYPSETYELVTWDPDIPNIYIYVYTLYMKNNPNVPNHQPEVLMGNSSS